MVKSSSVRYVCWKKKNENENPHQNSQVENYISRNEAEWNTVRSTGEKYVGSNTARNTVWNGMSETISAENFCQNPIPIKTLKLKTIFQEIQRSEIQLEIQVRNTEEVIQLEIQLEMVWVRQYPPRTWQKPARVRVGKCYIFYTEQIFQTELYPTKVRKPRQI